MLPPAEFINGLFSLLYVIFSAIVGVLIASKYSRYKDKTFLFIGIAAFGLATTHWPSSFSFLTNVLFDQPLPAEIFLFISSAFISIFIISWIFGISNLLFDEKNMKFLIFFVILHIINETIFLVTFFINPGFVGTVTPPYNLNAEMTGLMIVIGIINVITIISTGFWASLRAIKSTTPLIKLKGYVLFCSFLLWSIAIILDISGKIETIGLVFIRIFLMSSIVGFYIGFVMPEIFQKFFTKIKLLK